MKSVRLLPIVIFAAAALLVFKGIGLVTSGGYVFVGTSTAVAAGAHDAPEAELTPGPTMSAEPTLADTNPTLADTAPTMPASAAAPDSTLQAVEAALGTPEPPPVSDPAAPAAVTASAAHVSEPEAAEIGCPEPGQQANTRQIGAAIADATKGEEVAAGCPPEEARREAVPVTQDSRGNAVPLAAVDPTPETETEVLERLSERRAELNARAEELSMREALVAAAEKRIEERTAALEALEKQIDTMVADKKAMEEAGFKSLIAMYEGMKPADAAIIFNDLDLRVLLRLARGINPRKMAPIMAKMLPARAQELTLHMADPEAVTATAPQPGDLAALPQIVGK